GPPRVTLESRQGSEEIDWSLVTSSIERQRPCHKRRHARARCRSAVPRQRPRSVPSNRVRRTSTMLRDRQTLFLLTALVCCRTATRVEAQGRVAGQVVDSVSRRPVSGVEVSVRGTALRTTTAGDGRFAFLAVPPGTYTLDARRIGYAIAEIA